ncbi:P-loop containing nucleoside triphosphate hydrolase protein [Bisporella sp. PMI_857]|nr:P-loop containing nucleoside triphosphate hydrolase protein [Bisporella sp. PMI_857]
MRPWQRVRDWFRSKSGTRVLPARSLESAPCDTPALPLSLIADTGFSVVGPTRSDCLLDIVLVHGIQGHPEKTWAAKESQAYWPHDKLPQSFPKARVLVYGYDSRISHFFSGPANQNSFLGHAKNLLVDLQAVREDNPARPLLFICHSLGGILVKDILRRCEPGRESHRPRRNNDIYNSTIGILFLGTPHRGGNYGSLGKAAERVVRHLGFDTNNLILRDLQSNSTAFEIINDEFLRMLHNRSPPITIYSFQESSGLAGVCGLKEKVVDDESSKLGHRFETVATLSGNHMDMCRGLNYYGPDYFRLKSAIEVCFAVAEESGPRATPLPKTPVYKLPFERDPHFVGREKELQSLENLFSDDFCDCALVGLGGVGKTQIAVEFAYRLMRRDGCLEPKLRRRIFWLHASSVSRLEQGLREALKTCEALSEAEVNLLQSFQDWFCDEKSGKWLIIMDNADDEEIIFSHGFHPKDPSDIGNRLGSLLPEVERYRLCHFLPKKSGCGILYTSRNKICATRLTSRYGPPKLVMVDPMSDTDATVLIENGLKGYLTDEYLECMKGFTKQLALTLDMLPLAIVQAVAMMRENEEARDPKAYLELYNQVQDEQGNFLKEDFFDWRRDSDLPNPVFFSWKMSFELLKKREGNVVLLLSLFSVLDRQAIPEWLLAFCPEISRYSRTKALNLLQAFSFISPRLDRSASKKWQMHRLVQLATHAWIGRKGLEQTLQRALRMLADAFMGHLYGIEDRDLRVAKSLEYYPHAKSVLSLLGALGFNNRSRLVQTAVRGFADQFEDYPVSAGPNLTWAMEFISQRDFSSLESVRDFVEGLERGCGSWFQFNGIRPLVSCPIYLVMNDDGSKELEFDPGNFVELSDNFPNR